MTKDITLINEVENVIIESFLSLIMKLNESQLRPVFLKLTEWAQVKGDENNSLHLSANNVQKCWTFYNLMYSLGDALKSLFVPFFGYILRDAAQVLKNKESDTKLQVVYYMKIHFLSLFLTFISSFFLN